MLPPNDVALRFGWGSALYVSICIFLTILIVFRLESLLIAPARGGGKRPEHPGTDENGEPILRDPDGRSI